MKDLIFELYGERCESMIDHRSYTHNLSSCEIHLHSSVGRAVHWYHRGHGFESRSCLDFIEVLISQLLKLCV